MVVEERIYTLHHGKVPEYLALYEQDGRDIQLRILGCNVGYYSVDIGPQNTVVHLWAYDSLAERERRRAALTQNPEWQAYILKIRPLILVQETRILRPAGFFADWVSTQLEQADVI
ncbi:NIPSNAP family protein [Paracandidimonas soli]|uniref:NIPSNAP protein n=1 Tax=Paracandidimonas soli TaxID=1917182 RepID=A0A4V2VQ84_9BURK|nr:NIPSNAP family protein [Paracandidimonas soli]TCU93689.1 NIPSNAP protein [Paracandidimonas soli]